MGHSGKLAASLPTHKGFRHPSPSALRPDWGIGGTTTSTGELPVHNSTRCHVSSQTAQADRARGTA